MTTNQFVKDNYNKATQKQECNLGRLFKAMFEKNEKEGLTQVIINEYGRNMKVYDYPLFHVRYMKAILPVFLKLGYKKTLKKILANEIKPEQRKRKNEPIKIVLK